MHVSKLLHNIEGYLLKMRGANIHQIMKTILVYASSQHDVYKVIWGGTISQRGRVR